VVLSIMLFFFYLLLVGHIHRDRWKGKSVFCNLLVRFVIANRGGAILKAVDWPHLRKKNK